MQKSGKFRVFMIKLTQGGQLQKKLVSSTGGEGYNFFLEKPISTQCTLLVFISFVLGDPLAWVVFGFGKEKCCTSQIRDRNAKWNEESTL